MDITVKATEQAAVKEIHNFLKDLDPEQLKEIAIFIAGVRFGQLSNEKSA